eukprot:Pgem_evm1s17950
MVLNSGRSSVLNSQNSPNFERTQRQQRLTLVRDAQAMTDMNNQRRKKNNGWDIEVDDDDDDDGNSEMEEDDSSMYRYDNDNDDDDDDENNYIHLDVTKNLKKAIEDHGNKEVYSILRLGRKELSKNTLFYASDDAKASLSIVKTMFEEVNQCCADDCGREIVCRQTQSNISLEKQRLSKQRKRELNKENTQISNTNAPSTNTCIVEDKFIQMMVYKCTQKVRRVSKANTKVKDNENFEDDDDELEKATDGYLFEGLN